MTFRLDQVVPWGRLLSEYQRMFALSSRELTGSRIFGCADGPASFNAEATAMGGSVVSGDPLYRFSAGDIAARIDAVFDRVMGQTSANRHEFVWGPVVTDLADLGRTRRRAMELFLADYPDGRAEGRYVDCELPALPYDDASFDLALCSHFLFLYSDQLDVEFHVASVVELARIASEVRVFPLLELGSRPSRHVEPVVDGLHALGLEATIEGVDYEFQRGGNQLLRVRARPRQPRGAGWSPTPGAAGRAVRARRGR